FPHHQFVNHHLVYTAAAVRRRYGGSGRKKLRGSRRCGAVKNPKCSLSPTLNYYDRQQRKRCPSGAKQLTHPSLPSYFLVRQETHQPFRPHIIATSCDPQFHDGLGFLT
ncbi:unnamed protein product, partial [Ectocarpus sp. 4 AP-2014]